MACFRPLHSTAPARPRPHGFTMVELLVGMALALVTTVIIAQVITNAEGLRRTTSSGADAQVNGAIGLYALTRDLQSAGYGLASHGAAWGCPVRAQFGNAPMLNLTLAPATITADANGNATLLTLSAGRLGPALPMVVKANHANGADAFTVTSTQGVSTGDVMLAIPAAWSNTLWCTAFQVAAGTTANGTFALTSTVVPHVGSATASWNPATAGTLMPTAGYTADTALLMNLGRIVLRDYRIENEALVMRELQANGTMPAAGTVLASGIVRLVMLYGRDTSATRDGVIDVYDTTTPNTADGWSRVVALRVALVARSNQREKEAVTTASPVWQLGTTPAVTGSAACAQGSTRQCMTLTLPSSTGTSTEWQHYRYRVFDTVVPLRNVLWSNA